MKASRKKKSGGKNKSGESLTFKGPKEAQQQADELNKPKINGFESLEVNKEEADPGFTIPQTYDDILQQRAPEISKCFMVIQLLKKQHKELKAKISTIKKKLNSIPRYISKLNGKRLNPVSPEERETLSIELELLKGQLIHIKEYLETEKEKLKSLKRKTKDTLSLQNLKDKSNSKAYIKRNQYFIYNGVLQLLNEVLQGGDVLFKDLFNKARLATFRKNEEAEEEFYECIIKLFEAVNPKLLVLASGRLKSEIFYVIKLTLQNYNPRDSKIDELIFPEEKKEEVVLDEDPIAKSSALISSLMVELLNSALADDNQLTALQKLADLSANEETEEFWIKLDDFVYEGNEDLYVLCTGDTKKQLFEIFRKNLQSWDRQSRFEKIVFNNN